MEANRDICLKVQRRSAIRHDWILRIHHIHGKEEEEKEEEEEDFA